ncbi:unnamed protein product [marine sediment metagenome]|uniref:Uncharacterized protein n=1 Tax=marine sediment metagenome TaxID=412755 RepID=X0XR12_9ZZZZ
MKDSKKQTPTEKLELLSAKISDNEKTIQSLEKIYFTYWHLLSDTTQELCREDLLRIIDELYKNEPSNLRIKDYDLILILIDEVLKTKRDPDLWNTKSALTEFFKVFYTLFDFII